MATALIVSDITTPVRAAITDPSITRWSAATLYQYIFEGEMLIVNKHPESQYISRVANSTPTLLAAAGSSLTISTDWLTAMVHYVVHRVFLEDSDDSANAKLSAMHLQLFEKEMGV